MSIVLRDKVLNQRQLDAIVPVVSDLIMGRLTMETYEQACVEALEKAGCPLGYDTGLDRPGTVEQRASNWIVNGQVGMSSRAIYCHMMGLADKRGFCTPLDPDDLNRCLLLLDLIPEWKPRMHEMAVHGHEWAGLAMAWDHIERTFLQEVGLDWQKGKSAPLAHALMKQARGET